MLEFMELVQAAFYAQSRWNHDNSYAFLTQTARNLLDFDIANGIRLHIASLAAPHFATSYTLNSSGIVNGSLAFLYSSLPLSMPQHRHGPMSLARAVPGYRQVRQFRSPSEIDQERTKDALLHGRLYLPSNTLEALYLRRLSPQHLLRLNAVSDNALPNGGTLLAQLHSDFGKFSTECLFSTDAALIGLRGLYNFGFDPRLGRDPTTSYDPAFSGDHRSGRLSAGLEAYFSPLNKSGGLSTGLRFTTLPSHLGFPYTMTLTINPLMGNLSSTYAVQAGRHLSLCSQFDFNVYSYESDVAVGVELWQLRRTPPEVLWAQRMMRREWQDVEELDGVLRARVDNNGRVRVAWDCNVKELLVSLGAGLDLKRKESILGSIGLSISFNN